jgi:hypothetical protein
MRYEKESMGIDKKKMRTLKRQCSFSQIPIEATSATSAAPAQIPSARSSSQASASASGNLFTPNHKRHSSQQFQIGLTH